ncbi:flagellar basal body rod protein FlgC [Candidatus Desantisbacteria bacterium]|nr:flagellar basal body rod protein FlgC [Candidatus Desantisbacteria bacterium]
MNFFSAIDISASGLVAQRMRMNVISENISKIDAAQENGKEPSVRKEVVLAPKDFSGIFKDAMYRPQGVEVVDIVKSKDSTKMVYNPSHPYANKDGFVEMPNINIIMEMAEMLSASRAYEANVTAISSAKEMIIKTLEIGK